MPASVFVRAWLIMKPCSSSEVRRGDTKTWKEVIRVAEPTKHAGRPSRLGSLCRGDAGLSQGELGRSALADRTLDQHVPDGKCRHRHPPGVASFARVLAETGEGSEALIACTRPKEAPRSAKSGYGNRRSSAAGCTTSRSCLFAAGQFDQGAALGHAPGRTVSEVILEFYGLMRLRLGDSVDLFRPARC